MVVCVACAALRATYFLLNYSTGTGYTWLVADGLAIGAILAALARGPWGTRIGMRRIAIALCGASLTIFVVGYPFGIFRASRLLGMTLRESALNLLCAAILLLTLLVGSSRWKRLVNRPILQFFGEISYGVYLVHMLVFGLEDFLVNRYLPAWSSPAGHFGQMVILFTVAAAITVGLTYLSRRYFEEFFLRLKHRV
jgi:peptidoglycan/LPS O-acetylase OafA/YrhL